MARIRYLKPDFWKDEDLAELPFEVRLCFQGLWNFADKAGRLEDRPARLKIDIFPYDKVDIVKCLDLLSLPKKSSNRPFIQRYEKDGQKYIQILCWDKHQKPHNSEAESLIPPAPTLTLMEKGMEKGTEKGTENGKGNGNGEPGIGGTSVKAPLDNGYSTVKDTLNDTIKHVLEIWNGTMLPKIHHFSPERKKHLALRLKNPHFLENYPAAIKKIGDSKFCTGENDRGWKASVDWLLENDTNYCKALEGKYDNKHDPEAIRRAFGLKPLEKNKGA